MRFFSDNAAPVHPRVLDKSFTLKPDDAPAWQGLRQLPEAALVGLAVPRFLLRLPYGENTTSIDKFSYEEMSPPPNPSHYLWGNPALACATLLAQGFHKRRIRSFSATTEQPVTIQGLLRRPKGRR